MNQVPLVFITSLATDLGDSSLMATSFKRGGEKSLNDLFCLLQCNEPRRNTNNIGIVMLAGQFGKLNIPADRLPVCPDVCWQ